MSTLSGDWREGIDDVDAAIIDGYQSGVPVEERPFRSIGAALGIGEGEALERVTRLHESGIVRRFGAVLNPPVIGSSTLAAVQAPADRFDEIASVVNEYRQVNHNYARDHEWNMWFVVTAGSRARRDEILEEIEARTGCPVLNLPMLTDYYIDLEFPVVNGDRFARESAEPRSAKRATSDTVGRKSLEERLDSSATRISEEATSDLSALEAELLLAIQDGFPLSATPYRDIAAEIGYAVGDVLEGVERLVETGCIKRIGCVINHVVTGFDANCMVVWDVPDDRLDEWGERAGGLPYVTLCYHRPRRPDREWPYNLFTMIHGRDSDAVDAKIDELAAEYLPVEHERLYSTETLKQTGARYEDLVGR
ncbi:Lrp/AsnC family transcriptional regulator [Haloterrigena sp. SYSU A558-1]|uniref:siroheme decarboxylase n=1 Tax=Haloterrigena gelatinilytica TaxID=2741724 RepID=A0A8J8GLI4_9EURY|nr:Lrp/AsnC family transcriptional regulator [Haloterrigena gelatinilytica]NUB90639.1 Lrp/AsnC family transcriptional regulator [Haloterrigena gelatinilytica]NUC73543.1 Lrp/AsnC family transcriptional regulator [Haloterrigena gelatinilytica]